VLFFIWLFANAPQLNAQEVITPIDSLTKLRKFKTLVIPVVFYLPETSLGLGVSGVSNFRFKNQPETCRPSQIQIGAFYTLNKQWLFFLPFQLYLNNDDLKVDGELGYYRYFYNFYGIHSQTRRVEPENYFVNYPRARAAALKRVYSNWWLGATYAFDDFLMQELDSTGIIFNESLLGQNGGRLSALSTEIEFDSRDKILYPHRGIFAELEYRRSDNALGSDFNFTKLKFNATHFWSIKKNHILATNLMVSTSHGDIPFYYLNYFGGNDNARGYPDRRFQDRHFTTLQTEYRFPIAWRFKGNIFLGASTIGGEVSDLVSSEIYWSYGFGTRFLIDKKDQLHLRFDFGFTPDNFNFYFTIGEAF